VIPHIKGCSGNTDDQQKESVLHGKKVVTLLVPLKALSVAVAKARSELLDNYLKRKLCVVKKNE
jgi:hypothetical protein